MHCRSISVFSYMFLFEKSYNKDIIHTLIKPLYLLHKQLYPIVVGSCHGVDAWHSLDATGQTVWDQTIDVLMPCTTISTYQWATRITLTGILIVSQRADGIPSIFWCPDVTDNIPTLLVTYYTHVCLEEMLLGWPSVTGSSISDNATGFWKDIVSNRIVNIQYSTVHEPL